LPDRTDLSASDIADVLRDEVATALAKDRSDLDGVAVVTKSLLWPAIERDGAARVVLALAELKDDPFIAAALVDLSGRRTFRVTDIYSDDEIIDAALTYLIAMPNATIEDGHWAWTALWGWADDENGDIGVGDHFRLVTRLIDEAPWDDKVLWMIGNGPLGAAEAALGGADRVRALAASNAKVAHVRHLVEEDLRRSDGDDSSQDEGVSG